MNPAVTELALYDVVNVPGVAADVSHVNTRAVVKVSGPHFARPPPRSRAPAPTASSRCRRATRATMAWPRP